jgi:hypothetical protein
VVSTNTLLGKLNRGITSNLSAIINPLIWACNTGFYLVLVATM